MAGAAAAARFPHLATRHSAGWRPAAPEDAVLAAIASMVLLACAAPWLCARLGRWSGPVLALPPAALAAGFAAAAGRMPPGGFPRSGQAWAPSLGASLALRLDGLALLMAILICGIGALVVLYAGGYLSNHPRLGRFQGWTLAFMASMLGLVLADNLIALFVFWELTSVTSYMLIGFDHERDRARAAALQALLVTGLGGLALLAGFVLLGSAGGSFEISDLLARGDAVRAGPLYAPILALVLLGAFSKSAQFPFHFWLPNAMEAPTPASAYLHAATMVKAGVYLLARLAPVLGGTPEWRWLLTGAGAVTFLAGAWLALRQTALKRILAYSTVNALGVLVFLLGLGTERAVVAAMVYLLAHAFYKGALFLAAGAVQHETGDQDVTRLGGLAKAMPITAAAAALAALSMAGAPPFLGFIGKELLYEATLPGSPRLAAALTSAAVLSGALLVAVAGIVWLRPFLGAPTAGRRVHEAPPELWVGPGLLAGLGLLGGLLPGLFAGPLAGSAAGAVLGTPVEAHPALWHGFNRTLALSALTLLAGAAICAARVRGGAAHPSPRLAALGPQAWYEAGLAGLNRMAGLQTRLLQSGYLRFYLMVIIVATVGLTGTALFRTLAPAGLLDLSGARFYESGLAAVILMAAAATVASRSRLGAVAAMGVVGYGVALIFVFFGAPDLAMTQFIIETLTVILLVLVFYHLPGYATLSGRATRLRDGLVALSAGALMTCLVLAAVDAPVTRRISRYFLENSVPAAHGRNVVNVILVDFRALDTLGEITVLGVAAVGVFALLRTRPRRDGREARP
jgi:multicomponent Na+:H+ antiporter subunit A